MEKACRSPARALLGSWVSKVPQRYYPSPHDGISKQDVHTLSLNANKVKMTLSRRVRILVDHGEDENASGDAKVWRRGRNEFARD